MKKVIIKRMTAKPQEARSRKGHHQEDDDQTLGSMKRKRSSLIP
ncbi:hypothetical protein [Bacillus sp. X1(2014)]|nr:hypothetical protein [Bacillus sp. X1(2014)]